MSNGLLLVRYNSDEFSSWSWISMDKEYCHLGEVKSGDLNTLSLDAKDKRVILLVAGKSLLITTVDVPRGGSRTVASAIPYALEEQMAEDIELIHCARGERQEDGAIPVVAIAKDFLMELLQLLSTVEIYPIRIMAEPLLLPWHEGGLSILIRDDSAIVRNGIFSGFECPLDQLHLFISSLHNEMDENHRYTNISVWGSQNKVSDISQLLDEVGDHLTIENTYSDLQLLTGSELKRTTINLLTGFNGPSSVQLVKSWWLAAAMFLLAIAIYISTAGYRYYSIHSQIETVSQESETLFHKTFPDVKRLIESRLVEQAKQKLEQRRRAHGQVKDDLLALLLTLGEAKQRHSTIELISMEFKQHSLTISLRGRSVAQIEKFKQQLDANKHTTSEILSAISKDKVVEARIKIEANPT
jgi:general secretion pathway protein L